jgi:hypothetical protein
MFRIILEFGHDDRGKQDTVVQKPIQDLVGIKAELRAQRFNALQQQITESVQARVEQHNVQSNAALYLATNSHVTKSGSEIVVSASSNAPRDLTIKFKPAGSEVRIKSDKFDHTIQVWNVEPATTGMVYRQGARSSWSVLDNADSVERVLDSAFNATFGA